MNALTISAPSKAILIATGAFGVALVAFLCLYATQPISDPDFWWHLKTGEMMFHQKKLLQTDPFTFLAATTPSSREVLILKGYWLWEVTAYALYYVFGFNGIFLLNFLTVLATATVIIWQIRRHAINIGLAVPLLFTGFLILRTSYALERPQVMSFLFATILVGQLLNTRGGGKLGWPLLITMCLWSNLHGGFVVGVIILFLFAMGVTIEYRRDIVRIKHLLSWAMAGVCFSLINPNGWLAFFEVFNFMSGPLKYAIAEYSSTWTQFNEGKTYMLLLWLLVFIYGLGLTVSRRFYWPELLPAMFLAYFSCKYVRNVAFFSLAMLPAIGLSWNNFLQPRQKETTQVLSVTSIIISTALIIWLIAPQFQQGSVSQKVKPIYPEAAIDFIKNSGLNGRMFNSYEYGGYLIWKLSPEIKVFIDGRGVDIGVFEEYEKVCRASTMQKNNMHEYEFILNKYEIDYIIQPIYDGFGNTQPLMKAILPKTDWLPIYLDSQVYILARNVYKNKKNIDLFEIGKEEFKNRLLSIYSLLQRSNPDEVGFSIAYTGMLIYTGRYQEAAAEVDAIARKTPGEKMLPHLRKELNLLAGRLNRQQKTN